MAGRRGAAVVVAAPLGERLRAPGGFHDGRRSVPFDARRLHILAGAAAGVAAGLAAGRGKQRPLLGRVAGCSGGPSVATTATAVIEKPETHRRREYEHLQLPNGLQVILASDPACDKAAAALCVGVGRLHEPKEVPGLAHFCEHMLFLGTERFPEEAEYKRFVKGHGGKCNAATGDASTCYAFDVAPDHLGGALDRFSQFFVAPLFTPSATEREINAVDSEHSMRITDDGRRSYASLLLDANPNHPLHWGSGNAQSLRDGPRAQGKDPHSLVVEFYQKNYTSEDMTLAVLGREPLSELRQMIGERFAGVRKTGTRALRGDLHGGDEPPIRREDFPGVVLRTPSKDIRQMALSWQLPKWQVPFWPSKPGAYASFILGHEGEGSLLSALKSRGWASSLSAGVDNFGSFSQFEVSVTLTEEGLDHIEEVGALIFCAVRLLRATPVQQWVLEEQSQLRNVRFQYADDPQPYSLVNTLARNLQDYPAPEVLAGPFKMPAPDAELSAATLEHLTVEGVRVEIAAKRFKDQTTSKDPWYSGPYERKPLDESWRKAWSKAAGVGVTSDAAMERDIAEAAAFAEGLRLPGPNPFVPQDLSMRPPSKTSLAGAPSELPPPCLGVALRAFHRQDDKFFQPKATVAFRLHNPAVVQDVASYLRCRMWCSIVMEEMREYAYDARSAGLSYALSSAPGGLELSVSGFSDKLPVLLRAVARKMRETTKVPASTFSIIRDRYQRGLANGALKQRPCDFAARKSRELRHSLSFTTEDQLEALQQLTLSDFNGESGRLLDNCQIDALLMGNLDEASSAEVAAGLMQELQPQSAPEALPLRAEAALPSGYTVWRLSGTDEVEPNNNVRLEMQIPQSTENSTLANLLVRIWNPRFFEELRTKQQLGYIVQMSSTEYEGFVTIACTVQTEYPASYVRGQVDKFFEEYFAWLEENLDEAEFARQVAGAVANLSEEPKNLSEEFGRYWGEIARQRLDFGRRERSKQFLESLKLGDLLAFAREQVRTAPRLYVEVSSISSKEGKKAPEGAVPPREPDRVWQGPEAMEEFRANAEWVTRAGDRENVAPRAKL